MIRKKYNFVCHFTERTTTMFMGVEIPGPNIRHKTFLTVDVQGPSKRHCFLGAIQSARGLLEAQGFIDITVRQKV